MKKININPLLIVVALLIGSMNAFAQKLETIELTEAWKDKIYELAPKKASVKIKKKKKVLLFSLHTGFYHWVIPHTAATVEILAKKSNAFDLEVSNDINMFDKDKLAQFDAVVLNNNCSARPGRDLFYDALAKEGSLTDAQKRERADLLEDNLLAYVKNGGGIMAIHGGIVMQNNSDDMSELMGGSFDYHPKQQKIKVELVDPKHPLLAPFNGEAFEHIDEPYIFKNAYFDYDFHPLLSMDVNKIKGLKKEVEDKTKYIAWIKSYGKGRVFYSSPSHNAQSLESPALLEFFLNGILYATGDFKCDDSPIK